MPREIKFRAWCFNEGLFSDEKNSAIPTMVYDPAFWFHSEINDVSSADFMNHEDVLAWMQYSGIKDNYGNSIYEGDILEVNLSNRFKVRYTVCFLDGGFKAVSIHNGESIFLSEMLILKVIGNIYENNDLVSD